MAEKQDALEEKASSAAVAVALGCASDDASVEDEEQVDERLPPTQLASLSPPPLRSAKSGPPAIGIEEAEEQVDQRLPASSASLSPPPLRSAKSGPPATGSEEEMEFVPPPTLERARSRVGAIAVAGIGASRPVQDDTMADLEQAAAVPPALAANTSSTMGSSLADVSLASAVDVTATLVTDDEYEAELHRVIMKTSVKATNVEPIHEDEKRKFTCAQWCLALLVAFLVASVLGTTIFLASSGVARDGDDGREPMSPDRPFDDSTETGNEKDLEDFLMRRSFDQGEALRDYNSPQRIAMRYIAAEFPRRRLDEGIIDIYALATLFFSTGGTFWKVNTSWKSSSPVCSWYGVACDDSNHVVSIALPGNNLAGSIPPEVALLAPRVVKSNERTTGLVRLDLSGNGIGGSIPSEVSQLLSLEEFLLHDNVLIGAIPAGIANWENVEVVSLQNNELAGEVPGALCEINRTVAISVDCEQVSCSCCQPACTGEAVNSTDYGTEGTGEDSVEGNDDRFRRKM